MTPDEKATINRRCAIAANMRVPIFDVDGRTEVGEYWKYKNRFGSDGDCREIPDFLTPDGAALLIAEIERRGWTWIIRSQRDGRYSGGVFAGTVIADYHRDFSRDSPWIALALAFLAADEASKAQ